MITCTVGLIKINACKIQIELLKPVNELIYSIIVVVFWLIRKEKISKKRKDSLKIFKNLCGKNQDFTWCSCPNFLKIKTLKFY